MRVWQIFIVGSLLLMLNGCTETLFTWLADQPAPVATGDAAQGQVIFAQGVNGSPPCATCHQTSAGGGGFSVGPNLHGLRDRAANRVEGFSAGDYIVDSILHPAHFVVPGYQDVMFPQYSTYFSEQDVADVVAYLMGL